MSYHKEYGLQPMDCSDDIVIFNFGTLNVNFCPQNSLERTGFIFGQKKFECDRFDLTKTKENNGGKSQKFESEGFNFASTNAKEECENFVWPDCGGFNFSKDKFDSYKSAWGNCYTKTEDESDFYTYTNDIKKVDGKWYYWRSSHTRKNGVYVKGHWVRYPNQ